MSDAALIRECAAPPINGETIKMQIARAARRLRWNPNRVFNVWYGRAELSQAEREQARNVMLKNTRNQEVIRDEFNRGLSIVIGAAERFAAVDPEFFGPQLDALRSMERKAGSNDLA